MAYRECALPEPSDGLDVDVVSEHWLWPYQLNLLDDDVRLTPEEWDGVWWNRAVVGK